MRESYAKVNITDNCFCSNCGAPKLGHYTRGFLIANIYPHKITYRGKDINLTMSQVFCMTHLVRFGAISNQELIKMFMGPDAEDDKAIHVQIVKLRRALERSHDDLKGCLATIRGFGYELRL